MKEVLTLILLLSTSSINFINANIGIPFELVNGLMIIEADIFGQSNKFIFDTGANSVLLDQMYSSEECDSKKQFITISGETETEVIGIDQLIINDDIKINDFQAFLTNLNTLKEFTSLEIVGVLGGQLIADKLFIDYDNKVISTTSERSNIKLENTKKIHIVDGLPLITIQIENNSYTFLLDSGASAHIIDELSLQSISNVQLISSQKKIVDASAQSQVNQVAYIDVTNNGLLHGQSRYLVKDLSNLSKNIGQQLDGIISISSLNLTHLRLDYKNMDLCFQ